MSWPSLASDPSPRLEGQEAPDDEHQADADDHDQGRRSATVRTISGMTAGQACDPGLTDSTPTNAHSGRGRSHSTAGTTMATAAAIRASSQVVARRAVPQLGHEVGQGQHHERQRRVVVVLERGAVDARPRDPLGGEADRDEGQREAPPPEGHPGHEGHGRDAHPPDDQAAGVVDRGRGAAGEALLVEPDGLEVHRPRPPGRRGGVRRRQAVVVGVHLAGQVEQRLAGVARRPARRTAGGSRSAPTGCTR